MRPGNPFPIAYQFETVAKKLNDEGDMIIPVVVNAAFACELYLKYLLIVQGWKKNCYTHDLKLLFGKLDEYTQDKVREKADIFLWDQFLEEASLAFEKWRYAHQWNYISISIEDLMKFAKALREVAEENYKYEEET